MTPGEAIPGGGFVIRLIAFQPLLRYFASMTVVHTIAIGCLLAHVSVGQVKQRRSELNRAVPPAARLTEAQRDEASRLFDRVLEGFEEASTNGIPALFHTTVHLSLPGVEQGQFSRDQATQLFTSFYRTLGTVSCTVNKREDSLASPYLSASCTVRQGDTSKELNLYVSLIRTGAGWRIGHFSLY